MLWQITRDRSQWEQTDQVIDNWLKERQQLLVQLSQVAGVNPYQTEESEDSNEQLRAFCETLIDYVSAGHFEVFEKLAEFSEANQNDHLGLDRDLLVKILRTTIPALDFNAQFDAGEDAIVLKQSLSDLSEQLAQRFDLEDELINSYKLVRGQEPKNKPSMRNRP